MSSDIVVVGSINMDMVVTVVGNLNGEKPY